MAKELICSACGTTGKPKTETRGSFFIEVILWLCFLIPGMIYTVWRLTTRRKVCRACSAHQLLPLDSPAGKALAAKYSGAD